MFAAAPLHPVHLRNIETSSLGHMNFASYPKLPVPRFPVRFQRCPQRYSLRLIGVHSIGTSALFQTSVAREPEVRSEESKVECS